MTDNDNEIENQGSLIVYGTNRCPAALFARRYLEQQGVEFQWIDIDSDTAGRNFVLEQAGGHASVPTFCLPDGKVLVEPSVSEIKRRFRSKSDDGGSGFLNRLMSIFGS